MPTINRVLGSAFVSSCDAESNVFGLVSLQPSCKMLYRRWRERPKDSMGWVFYMQLLALLGYQGSTLAWTYEMSELKPSLF